MACRYYGHKEVGRFTATDFVAGSARPWRDILKEPRRAVSDARDDGVFKRSMRLARQLPGKPSAGS